MFKLLKDLTRPPEPLSPRQSISEAVPTTYTPRHRRTGSENPPSLTQSPTTGLTGQLVNAKVPPTKKEVEETDGYAKIVVMLLHRLEEEGDSMHYVETLMQLNGIPPTRHSLGAFRRHEGFEILTKVLGEALAWQERVDISEEERQVQEVQRMEGVRIGLEALAWALKDRENRRVFENMGGYLSLLPALRAISPLMPTPQQEDPSTSQPAPEPHLIPPPHPLILAHLLAHMFTDNYSILSIFDGSALSESQLKEKVGDLNIRHGAPLTLLWAYLWSLDEHDDASSRKGKARARMSAWEERLLTSGHQERSSDFSLVRLTFSILSLAAQQSHFNTFSIRTYLPELMDFLVTRLYGYPDKRKYEVTFPPRDDWCDDLPEEDIEMEQDLPWVAPPDELRAVYLVLLRHLLEGGVDQRLVWRLFSLVKVTTGSPNGNSSLSTGQTTPMTSNNGSPNPDLYLAEETPKPKPARKRQKPGLHISTNLPPPEMERLQPEVLDLLRHAMKSRWPPAFLLRGGSGDREGGLELRDMGRSWPAGPRGFSFSCWIHVSKLNRPVTLLHASQAGQKQPLFRIRLLENSQIALLSSIAKPLTGAANEAKKGEEADGEIICAAPDALIPHHQWIHFSVGCRKPKGAESAEVRIFVNGVRVGAMRMTYPSPLPLPTQTNAASILAKPGIPPEAIRLCVGRDWSEESELQNKVIGKEEENEFLLGRVLLIEEAVPEDLVLLMHHLGPRYSGNMQEALGKFLTYEGATSINVYLSSLAQGASDKRLYTSPANSVLVKAIRQGPAFGEDQILLSTSAKYMLDVNDKHDACLNGAIPHPSRARQYRHGTVKLVGNIETYTMESMDESVSSVGGGAVILKMIDLATTSEELAIALGLLKDMIKDSWAASEEMERIRGFEMLAAILRPKMPTIVDAACTKIILSMLGVHMDKPTTATVHNSAAYRALGLEFELWSHASLGVVTLYLQHFEYLLSTSKHARYNVLRTFQKSAMVRKMLFALRLGYFELEIVPVVVETLKLALLARWSGEDGIKPVFSYLVSALCQSNGSFSAILPADPPPSQAAAAQILQMIAELTSQPARLVKLNKSLALHRLLVIFLSSNSAFYVLVPCLDILEKCLSTTGLESFQRSFEAEGGFALLARTLGPCWRDDVQGYILRMMIGSTATDKDKDTLACPSLLSTVLAALDYLLQTSAEEDGRPAMGRTRSGTITSVRAAALTPLVVDTEETGRNDTTTSLESLLKTMTAAYHESQAFKRCMTGRKIEQMLPAFTDFAAVSATSNRTEVAKAQRAAAAEWLQALHDGAKVSNTLLTQIKLILEQLRVSPASPKLSSSSFAMSPSSPRPSTSYFGSSLSGRLATTPPASPAFGSSLGTFTRRRPSTDAGPNFPGMGLRRMSTIEKRAPLKRVLTGESILEGGRDKNAAWKLIIIQTDSQSHSKMTLERKEHWQRVSDRDWPRLASSLRAENGLWPDEPGQVFWRLDGSEGPLRMRTRLERVTDAPEHGAQRTRSKLRDAIPSVDELSSAVSRMNAAPWEDPFSLALGEAAPIAEEESPLAPQPQAQSDTNGELDDRPDDESHIEIEDNRDDKTRRIAKTLQAGDVVEEAHNIVRIVGVDACPGLLILGKRNLYLVDGLVQTAEGEVIDAKDAPRDVLSVPGTLAELDPEDQESHRWSYNEIVENNKRAFLFRDVALELYFSDKRNFLIVFKDKKQRQHVVSKLSHKSDQTGSISKSIVGNFLMDQVARAIDRSSDQLEAMSRRWQAREISNFAYLMLLNQHANRTPNDVTQYPVFPWVLADYTSQILDLESKSSYRDLTWPMGALTPARKEAAMERYSATEGVGEQPFHYGTHYSSSMIVCGFMIRLSPFTEIFLALQGGNFDLADRLFSSIPRAWDSACADNRGDVRELIPEFFYSAAFLLNVNRHDFGRKQVSGDSVDNVVLPPWALGDPSLFIHRHREALESDYVSRHLHSWIDLTFGYKQRDPASFNCFHPLSYRGAVDLENITDESEKAASTAIIHNFGQTPLQIFRTPHLHRAVGGRSNLPTSQRFGVAEQWELLMRSIIPILETPSPIHDIHAPSMPEAKPTTTTKNRLIIPNTSFSVQYGFVDQSLRVYYQELSVSPQKLIHLVEGHDIEHAILATPTLLVTVSPQGVLTAWRMNLKPGGYRRGDVSLTREATLRGHNGRVTTLTASAAWSLLVSGTEDGEAIVWDTNRLRYTRTLQTPHQEPLLYSAINEADGMIALASKHHLYLFSLNGHPIASTVAEGDTFGDFTFGLPETPIEPAESALEFTGGITFLRRDFLKFGALFVVGINNEIALFRCVPGERRFEDEDVKPWKIVEQGRLARSDDHPYGECCMVKFMGETLYAAFEARRGGNKWALYQWSLPEGDARHVPESVSAGCMATGCGRHFGLLEPRRHCGGCGGLFCGTHALHVEYFQNRYCEHCRAQLAEAQAMGIITKRKDSAYPSSRRGSILPSSVPGSRRPSISSRSRTPSRVGSRSASRVGSRRPSVSGGANVGLGIHTPHGTVMSGLNPKAH